MLQLIDTLYHGTAEKFETIDVFKGRNNKDFGKGFYMAVTKKQAIGMMHKKYREALLRRPNVPKDRFSETLYEIKINVEYAKTLNIKHFNTTGEEWLDFILMCREKGGLPHNFDLAIGPTADDDTMFCLNSYWRGFYGQVGSEEAKIEHLKGLSVINATKHLMSKYGLSHEDAYKKLLSSETYRILMENDSGLYLESDSYLNTALDSEFEKNKEALYEYISNN